MVNAAEALGHRVGRDVRIVADPGSSSAAPGRTAATCDAPAHRARPQTSRPRTSRRLKSAPCLPPTLPPQLAGLHEGAVLRVEMVPEPLWGMSAKKTAPDAQWSPVRARVIDAAGGRCGACRDRVSHLECHEQWSYDDERCVQTLTDLVALCVDCHGVKTPGRQQWLADTDPARYGQLPEQGRAHLARVNGWTATQVLGYIDWCARVNAVRGAHAWTQSLGRFFRAADPFSVGSAERLCPACFQVVPVAGEPDCPH